MRKLFPAFLLVLLVVTCGSVLAEPLKLTLNTVFAKAPLWGRLPSRITWSPDGRRFTYVLPSQDPTEPLDVHLYDVASGRDAVVIPAVKFGLRGRTPGNVQWSPNSRTLLFVQAGDLYTIDLRTRRMSKVALEVSDPQWSPASDRIAYVHGEDLYVARLGPHERIMRLTKGGVENQLLNGDLDWVYPEELGTEHGFAWAPDGHRIAYLHFDERPVTAFPLLDFLPPDNRVSLERYPLAGEKNPRVSLRTVSAVGGSDRLIYDAGTHDEYLPAFGWRPHTQSLVAEIIDRAQQHLRFLSWNGPTAKPTQLYTHSDSKWVEVLPMPRWVGSSGSLWLLEQGGTTSLYRMTNGGSTPQRLSGRYRVLAIEGVDEAHKRAFVSAAYPTRRDHSLLAIPLRGGALIEVTRSAGSHAISMSANTQYFIDTHSTFNQAPQVDLVAASGALRKTLAPEDRSLSAALLKTQPLEVDSQFGKLDAYIIKPPSFDPQKRYPVIIYVYGGPAAPTTSDSFGYQTGLYHQLLARAGYIVFSIDGPASQIDTSAAVRRLYHAFGPVSLAGQEEGVRYLKTLPYVDTSRLGIWGWSFGGYETTYAMTHTQLFKAGAAVAPVTDWHLYDSIYTERYMGLPLHNRAGYTASSVLPAAKNLYGKLLISHGTSDDNVHMANTIELLQQFVLHDKQVDFMVYPRKTHSISGVPQRRHLFEHMLNFWQQNL
ncbi:MAG: DPP IV N-terminal domain-containing protein [Candidatus Eremiobacteraeota bacterium]|nr:DPP IV N-terminal domain-containing protein [Candidatus Eremiobacteraeota bacterium]